MREMTVSTADAKLAERAVVEHVRRTRRLLARVLFSNYNAHRGVTEVVYEVMYR
jgi:hypothetical protein